MRNLLRVGLLTIFALLVMCGTHGCEKGITPIVGDILGPDAVNENTSAEFRIITDAGTGITYAWSSDNPDLCEFIDPMLGIVEAHFGDVEEDTILTLRVIVDSDQYGPIIKSREVTVKYVSPLYTGEIAGPDILDEYQSSTYSIEASGVLDITYSWSCEPPDAGQFTDTESPAAGFEAGEVTADTEIEIRVAVGAEGYEPVMKVKVVTIRQTVGLYVEEIDGPDVLEENTSGRYLISAEGDSGLSYQWSNDPEDIGWFDDPTSPTPEFTCITVQGNILVEIRVVVYSNHFDPVIKTKLVTIMTQSPFAGARAWGSYYIDSCNDIATDPMGNFYVTGEFESSVDFDFGTDYYSGWSAGGSDIFLGKYNSYGDLQWVRTWGGHYSDGGRSVAVDTSYNVYVTGYFRYTADFHPGSGTDIHTSAGYDDAFLSKFDYDGELKWAHTWGGPDNDYGNGVAIGKYVYVTGSFHGTVDFDPAGDNAEDHSANGLYEDAFLSCFSVYGHHEYAHTWGGIYDDAGIDVAVDPYGDACVTGYYRGDVDFNLGSTVDIHSSNGLEDAFVMLFTNYYGAYTWGGIGSDSGEGIAIGPDGEVYVTGYFAESVDFDPGSGIDIHDAENHYSDAYLTVLDKYGEYQWARTWGGTMNDAAYAVAVDDSGNAYVTGAFRGEIEYDTGVGDLVFTSNGIEDVFFCVYEASGDPIWAGTWGGIGVDQGTAVALAPNNDVYIGGFFSNKVDFDPTVGVTEAFSRGMYDAFIVKFISEGFE